MGIRNFEDMTPYKGRLWAYGDKLLKDIIPGNIIKHLPSLATEDKEHILSCINHEGNQRATMELLIRIQRGGGDEWFKEFVSALEVIGYNDLVNLLLQPPDTEHVEMLRNPHEQISGNPNEGRVEILTVNNPPEQISGNPNEDNQYSTPRQDPDRDNDDTYDDKRNEKYDDEREKPSSVVAEKELELREYQKKLAKPVIAGKNTIIISHTGSGKTVVAVHFVKEHFNQEQASKMNVKPKKVVFLVNTTSLVAQQHDLFNIYLSSSLRLCQMIGDTTTELVPIKNLIESNDVIFLTAQILVNALQKNYVKIDDFSMLVFDECHHCHHLNPYNAIMAIYRKRKLGSEGAAMALPQIVGLTASVGTGRASTQDKSDEYVKGIFANLDVEAISVPDDNDEEYQLYVNPPEEIDPILVKPRPDDKDPFKTMVMSIMCKIEQMLEEGVIQEEQPKLKDLLKFRDSPKGSSAYEQGVENFKSHCPQVVKSESLLRLLRTAGEHLRKYNDALMMNKICRIEDGLRSIQGFIHDEETTRSGGFNDDDRKLIRLFKEREEKLKQVSKEKQFENPLLIKLESVLIKEFRKENSHAIIFCTKRTTVDAMYNWIKESDRLSFLKPEKIFGSSEMTPAEQKSVLQNFKNNECNILVGTNVVEEGTDVPACNLVFRYNYMSSDVGRKQAKGRVRAKNSKFYMVASTEFNFEERDQANKIRDIFMMKSVRTLSKIPNDKLKEDLLVLQNIDLRERERNERVEREKRESRTTAEYKLLCGKCSELACVSSDVWVFNNSNHLIINEEFYTMKVRIEKHPKPMMIDDIHKNGKIFCKKCKHDWGVIVTISNMNFGVIKISSFLLEKSADGKKRTCKKWKDSPFKVKKIDMVDFKTLEWIVELPYEK